MKYIIKIYRTINGIEELIDTYNFFSTRKEAEEVADMMIQIFASHEFSLNKEDITDYRSEIINV